MRRYSVSRSIVLPRTGPLVLALALAAIGCDADRPETPKTSKPAPQAAEPSAPRRSAGLPWNVVLVTLDTTRADALGSYAQNDAATPQLDAFAEDSVVFKNAAASSPSTLPSHSTIFTGKPPYAHGARSNQGYVLAPENVTLAEVLSKAGYATRAEISAIVLRPETGITQGFEQVTHSGSDGVQLKQVRRKTDGASVHYPIRLANEIADNGIDFIRENRSEAFFLWLHFFDAHTPYGPPRKYLQRYPDDPYRASVAYEDAQVGRVIEAIDSLGLRDHTLIVVTADHGESLGEHGVTNHSFYVYESTMQVPLLVRGPAPIVGGRRVKALVRTADIAPTILDLVGLSPLEGVEGVSLRPLLDGSQGDLGLVAYGETLELTSAFGVTPLRYLREGSWKYIHKVEAELYDLAADPDEITNRASDEPERVAALRAKLRERVAAGSTTGSHARVEVDAATREQLAALGYSASAASIDDELASLELSGPDASEFIEAVKVYAEVQGHLHGRSFALAEERVAALLTDHPDSFLLLRLSSNALEGLGRFDEAAVQARAAVEQNPDSLDMLLALGRNLVKADRRVEAVPVWEQALAIDPCNAVRQQIYLTAYQRGDLRKMYESLDQGVKHCPDSPRNLINFAWVLATIPDDSLRDGRRALELAQRGVSLLDHSPDPAQIDTLAAAFAENGDFEAAIREQRKALAAVRKAGASESVQASFRAHLVEYEAGRAVRDPQPATP